jgi:hypothetical protein
MFRGEIFSIVFSSADGFTWVSADMDALINRFIPNTIHNTLIGISSLNGLYFSETGVDWELRLSGEFAGVAADNRTGVSLASSLDSVYRSTDGGWTWKQIASVICGYWTTGDVSFIPELGAFLIFDLYSRVIVSFDQGDSWQVMNFPYAVRLLSLHYGSGMIIAEVDHSVVNSAARSQRIDNSKALLSIPARNMTLGEVCFSV